VLNHPVPPREIDPTISPELEEIVYRVLERDPKKRYASARDFAWDLAHPRHVMVRNRSESQDWRKRRSPRADSCWTCADSHCYLGLDAPGGSARVAGQCGRNPTQSLPFRAVGWNQSP
jgi:hypothetical protein